MKPLMAEFMSLWDGLITSDQTRVTVLAATNRAFDIDQAVLRRLPCVFFFPFPDAPQRALILNVCLRGHKLSDDVDIVQLSHITEGYSGSDLKELCKAAVLKPVGELFRQQQESKTPTQDSDPVIDPSAHRIKGKPRTVSMQDFYHAMTQVRASGPIPSAPPSNLASSSSASSSG